jgi:transposase
MAMGRPTKYDPAMCATVVEMMAEGCSKVEVCAALGICYETWMNFQKAHEDFSLSVKRGEQLSEAWWQREGRTNLKDRDFSATLWYMNMKNRFGWKDKHEVDNTSSDGTMTPTKIIIQAGDNKGE